MIRHILLHLYYVVNDAPLIMHGRLVRCILPLSVHNELVLRQIQSRLSTKVTGVTACAMRALQTELSATHKMALHWVVTLSLGCFIA